MKITYDELLISTTYSPATKVVEVPVMSIVATWIFGVLQIMTLNVFDIAIKVVYVAAKVNVRVEDDSVLFMSN